MLNRIVIMGRLVRDPELRSTASSNLPVCTFTVAVDRDFSRAGEPKEADFIDVVTWRQTAEFVSKYFSKGRMICVDGRLQTRKWRDKNDQPRVSYEIVADNVSFCGDKPRDDARTSDYGAPRYDNPAPRYSSGDAPRYSSGDAPRYSGGDAPRYSNDQRYSAPAPAPQAAPLPEVSDFSELDEAGDDKVPF